MPTDRSARGDAAPLRVVIVDDVERTRELLHRLAALDDRLEVVAEAADGLGALEMVRDEDPDVVLLDVRMPVMDGIDALHAIKQDRPDVRVVMYSADSTRRREALDAGADAWVDKTESFRSLSDALVGHDEPRAHRLIDLTEERSTVE